MATPAKYTVSFNSDTSDSEEEVATDSEEEDTESEESEEEDTESPANSSSKPAAINEDDVTEVSFSLGSSSITTQSPSPGKVITRDVVDNDEEEPATEFTLDFSFSTSESVMVNGTSTPDDLQATPQFTFSLGANADDVTAQGGDDVKQGGVNTPTKGLGESSAAGERFTFGSSVAQSASAESGSYTQQPQGAATLNGLAAAAAAAADVSVGATTIDGSCPGPTQHPGVYESQQQQSGDQCPTRATPPAPASSSTTAITYTNNTQPDGKKLFSDPAHVSPDRDGNAPVLAKLETAAGTLLAGSAYKGESFEEGKQTTTTMVLETDPEPCVSDIGDNKEGEDSVCVNTKEDLNTSADISEASPQLGTANTALDKGDTSELVGANQDLMSFDKPMTKDAGLDIDKQRGLRLEELPSNMENTSTDLDKQTDGEADKNTSLTKVKSRDKHLKGTAARNIALSDGPLQSPTRKSAADDDFEARISRAKAFIQSTNDRLSQTDEKNEEKFSSSASEKSEAMDADDPYILGTVAVTSGSKKGKDLYTDDDILAKPIRFSVDMEEEPKKVEKPAKENYGDPADPHELIKRILAEARGDNYEPPKRGFRDEEECSDIIDDEDERSSVYTRRKRRDDPSEDQYGSTSLLERRIQSMKKRNAELAADDFNPRSSRSSRHSAFENPEDAHKQMVLSEPRDDDTMSTTSSRASALRRKYKGSWMDKPQQGCEDDEVFTEPGAGALVPYEEPDEEDILYKTRRALRHQNALPDEAFIPRKSEDTDEIVQEKTMDIRNVVSKQESVLEDLRKASQSFDELEDEIKEIRQQFYESQEKRALIHEEIEYDLELSKQHEEELAAEKYARKYAPPPTIDYTKGYIPSNLYSTPKAITWEKEQEPEEESLSAVKGLAIRSSGWTGPGTRLTSSASLDYGRESIFDTESQSSMPSYRQKQRPTSARRQQQRSMYDRSKTRSLMEDYDRESDYGDDASSRMSRDMEDVETIDEAGENVSTWKSSRKMNGDNGRDHASGMNSWRPKNHVPEEGEGEPADELSAKINSWRAKMEVDTEDTPLTSSSALGAWRAANKDDYKSAASTSYRSPYSTGELLGDTGGSQTRSSLLNNNHNDSNDLGAYSWKTKVTPSENNGDKGAYSWRSILDSREEDSDTGPGTRRSRLNDLDEASDQGAYSWRSRVNNTDDPVSNGAYSWRSKANGTTDDVGDTGAHSWRSRLNNSNSGNDVNGTSAKPYSWSTTKDASDNNNDNASASSYRSKYGTYGKTYSADDSDTTPSYSTASYGGYSGRLARSSTLSDYEYQRPDRRARARSCEPGSGTGFKSKFLNKVREQKASGETAADKSKDKPFKSRFLKSSFGTDSGSTPEKSTA